MIDYDDNNTTYLSLTCPAGIGLCLERWSILLSCDPAIGGK